MIIVTSIEEFYDHFHVPIVEVDGKEKPGCVYISIGQEDWGTTTAAIESKEVVDLLIKQLQTAREDAFPSEESSQ